MLALWSCGRRAGVVQAQRQIHRAFAGSSAAAYALRHTRHADPPFPLEADNTYQRGAIRLYRLLKTDLCWFGFSIRFDFTDNPNVDKIADRFAFVAPDNAADDDLKAFYTEIMHDGLLDPLVAFTVLNFSKQAVETTKENLAEYNRLRRSLGQKKLIRQEYHIVRINTAALAETAAPLPRQSSPPGITTGEHSVRGHYRHYKSGLVLWINEHRRGHGECKSKR